ncbi:MAG TPA: ABC transporter substrate-binding protein [Thermotogota bacterium]|nr:ABC transporter substrate-binding protein [Thermotogota bacterium]NLH18591.1 ABC transporter substrate-binding protein [Thermotogaceae bacterium]OQC32581.1 MAG: Periplasmic dipeptide transport protein precursor [Thermotogota bacterium ADurb.Bin062]HNW45932.1 ABC transporter substrate-binding protein [Thermotogota bacterium]HOD90752.1 ABC transporter substrate-binding protein [Thermotogota bacterium]
MKKSLLFLLVLTVFFSFCFGARAGGDLKFAVQVEPAGFDPNLATAFGSHRLLEHVYEGLLSFNENMDIVPGLAESFEVPEPTKIVFHLRKNVLFHDGTPFTAEDVLYTFKRIQDPAFASPAASYYTEVSSITAPDPYTVVFTLKVPMVNSLLLNFAGVNSAIVCKKTVESGVNMQLQTNGTGPFKLKEYAAGNYIALQKNERYYVPGLPLLDSLTFVVIPEEISRSSALRNADVQMAQIMEPLSLNTFPAQRFVTYRVSTLPYLLLGINNAAKPFDNVLVRRALSYAINREELVEMVAFGEGTVTGPLNPSLKTWALLPEAFDEYSYNPEKAKALLKEAGYPNGFSFEAVTYAQYSLDKIGEAIQAQLALVGIQMKVDVAEFGIFVKRWREIDFQTFLSLNGGSTEPDIQFYRTFKSDGATNKFNFKNAKVDELLEKGRQALDLEERVEIYRALQRLLVEENPFLFLYSPNNLYVSLPEVKGFVPMSNQSLIMLKKTWLDK